MGTSQGFWGLRLGDHGRCGPSLDESHDPPIDLDRSRSRKVAPGAGRSTSSRLPPCAVAIAALSARPRLDEAIGGFYDELSKHGQSSNVLIATWSEFGRRPEENSSTGTDHGTAAPLILIGDPVAKGVYGQTPDLKRLDDDGNLRYTVDFRSIYQEVLDTHLGVDAKEILGARFDRIPFLL